MNKETLATLAQSTDWTTVLTLPQEEQVARIIADMRADVSTSDSIEVAQCARTVFLRDTCGRSAASIAAEVGVSGATIGRWYDRGKVLALTGATTSLTVIDQLGALSRDQVQALQAEVTTLTTPEDRSIHVAKASLGQVAKQVLGDATTPERVDSMVATFMSDGITTPAAARRAAEPIATRLGIVLQPRKRAAGEAEQPLTITTAAQNMIKALDDRRAADSLHITTEEADALDRLFETIATFIDEAKVAPAPEAKAAPAPKAKAKANA